MPRDRPTTLEDEVRAISDGDTSAFDRIVAATSSRLLRLAARMLGDLAEAEDVVQESYVKMYDALVARRFDGRASVDTWAYRLVTNAAIDALRARATKARAEKRAMEDEGTGYTATVDARLALRELADWLEDLPADQRAALVLKEDSKG